MDRRSLFTLFILLLVAFFMIMIGVLQSLSKKPVGFYSGEKGPAEEKLTDTQAWNRKHGIMWVIYGIIIILTSLIGVPILDSVWCIIPLVGGLVLPVPVMIWYHQKLTARYRKA